MGLVVDLSAGFATVTFELHEPGSVADESLRIPLGVTIQLPREGSMSFLVEYDEFARAVRNRADFEFPHKFRMSMEKAGFLTLTIGSLYFDIPLSVVEGILDEFDIRVRDMKRMS